MSKAKNGPSTAKTESPGIGRRAALLLTAGAVTASGIDASCASAPLALKVVPSPQYLDCAAGYELYRDPRLSDVECSEAIDVFYKAVDRYLAVAPSIEPMQRLGELNAIWRMDIWYGDERVSSSIVSEAVELAISEAIEQITNISMSRATVGGAGVIAAE